MSTEGKHLAARTDVNECRICPSNAGSHRISPGQPIFRARWWRVEHAYPTALPGWLVIVLERHAEALHELTESEAVELGRLQLGVARVLRDELGCVKEYSMSLGEGPGFGHLHFHLVPRAGDLDPGLRGARIFTFLQAPPGDFVSPDSIADLCARLSVSLANIMSEVAHHAEQIESAVETPERR